MSDLIPGFGQVLYIKDAQGNLAIVGPDNPLPMSGGSGGGGGAVTVDSITDATTVGKSVLKAADAAAARTAIGAGTSSLAIGTTASTAKAGNWTPAVADITGATTVGKAVLGATDAAAARTAIGAGTSNLKVGDAGTDAKAGNWAPNSYDLQDATEVGKSLIVAANAAAARTAIGAGTSNLAIGTTSTTAKAGDYAPPAATTAANGTVKMAAAQANSTATDVAGLVADFNALLGKLRTAGIIAP